MTKSSGASRQTELSKAHQEIILLKRRLKIQVDLVESTEKIIKASLDIGASIWVRPGIRAKQKAIASIEKITAQIIEAKKNFDLWKAIEEVHTAAPR